MDFKWDDSLHEGGEQISDIQADYILHQTMNEGGNSDNIMDL